MTLVETLIDHNDRHKVSLSYEKLQQAVSTVLAEIEEEERDSKRNDNNVTRDNFIQSLNMTNTPTKKTDIPNERWTSLDMLAETMKGFNRLTLNSSTNDSAGDHSDKNDANNNQKSNQVVGTHTSDKKRKKSQCNWQNQRKISTQIIEQLKNPSDHLSRHPAD